MRQKYEASQVKSENAPTSETISHEGVALRYPYYTRLPLHRPLLRVT